MTPRARITGLDIVEQDGGLLIRDRASDAEHVLHPLSAFVWKHADGRTDVPTLVSRASQALDFPVTEEQIWAAIDVLTGARLLESRVAPPAGTQRVARRDLLRTVAVGSAAAAALGVVTTPSHAEQAGERLNKQEESLQKVSHERANKVAAEEREKLNAIRHKQEEAQKAQHQAQENAQKAQEQSAKIENHAAEAANKQQEQAAKSAHEQDNKSAAEERSKNSNPFTMIELVNDWANFDEGFAPMAFERRGPHIHLVGLIEFTGEPEFADPPDPDIVPCFEPDPNEDLDHDEFEVETMLIGRLPAGARPPATLLFTVPSDSLLGSSEVMIMADGEIHLVLDDESDDQLDAALAMLPPGPVKETESLEKNKEGDFRRACIRKALRRRRHQLRKLRQRQRKLLRKRARQARRRCLDGQEVLLTGPSEISFSGISFRVAP